MPRKAREMTALDVKRAKYPTEKKGRKGNPPVTMAAGGVAGLLLQLTPNDAKSWLLRTTVAGKRRAVGLGAYPEVSLAEARDRARAFKGELYLGNNPIAERKAAKAAALEDAKKAVTFADVLDLYVAKKLIELSSEKNRKLWENMVRTYAVPTLGKKSIGDITVHDVVGIADPIWQDKRETAKRVCNRVEGILDWAAANNLRSGRDVVVWRATFRELLPQNKQIKLHHAAVQIEQVAEWFAKLRKREGNGSRALEFLVLTAARSGEVRGATWDEIDLDTGRWVVSADRMKMDREHRVPLSNAALRLLKSLPHRKGLLFPAKRGGELSDATLSGTMKRIHSDAPAPGFFDRASKRPAVPHGLRSTFRDWAAETTSFAGDLVETALAHKVSNAVEAAYRRGDMLKKRRQLMEAWAGYLAGREATTGGEVVPLRGRANG